MSDSNASPSHENSELTDWTEDAAQGGNVELATLRNSAIADDHNFIKEYIPSAALVTLSKEFITLVIIRTQYARVTFKVRYTEGYPTELPTLELTSPTLPLPLLQNKEKECLDNARKKLGGSMIRELYEPIHTFIHTNMFVPCWKEMKQVATLCEGKGKVGADEKDGVIQLRMQSGAYKHTMKITVPYYYPEEGVKVEFQASNFPSDIQYMFLSQVEEIVRRCVGGATMEQALLVSNPIKLTETSTKQTVAAPKMTAENIRNLKHDVNVLKQISDLRVAATTSDAKKYITQVNAERREARRDLRKLAKAESEAEAEAQKAQIEQEQAEMRELIKGKASEVAQPSLYAAVRFLVEDFTCRLPHEPCQACRKPVLTEHPEGEGAGDAQGAQKDSVISSGGAIAASKAAAARSKKASEKPMRTFCGHWLHFHCLNEWLTTPPFVRSCPACGRRIWHPDWPEDHKQLEKAWQAQEARKREMCDVRQPSALLCHSLPLTLVIVVQSMTGLRFHGHGRGVQRRRWQVRRSVLHL